MDLVSYNFSREFRFEYLEATFGLKGSHFINTLFQDNSVRFKCAEAKYWTCCTVFNKYFISGPYLMDPISYELYSKVPFKY